MGDSSSFSHKEGGGHKEEIQKGSEDLVLSCEIQVEPILVVEGVLTNLLVDHVIMLHVYNLPVFL